MSKYLMSPQPTGILEHALQLADPRLGTYQLRPDEMPELERKLSGIHPSMLREGEVLDKETFALARAVPEILENCNQSLVQRITSGEFRIKRSFYSTLDKDRATTYALLNSYGFNSVFDYVKELVDGLKGAQDRLTRFLQIYAPGSLTDTQGSYTGQISGEVLQGVLSSLFSPKGFQASIDIRTEQHTIEYGKGPLELPSDSAIAYLNEMAQALFTTRESYGKLARTLVFLGELDGNPIDIDGYVQRHQDLNIQVDAVNNIINHLASLGEEALRTEEGIRAFNALHNALDKLIGDIPLDGLNVYGHTAQRVFNDYIAPFHARLWPSKLSHGASRAKVLFGGEINSPKQLEHARGLMPTQHKMLLPENP